jgi:hypothetical protein
VSFLLAAFTWTVPLAAIYPPSAITIDTSPFLVTERLPISVPEITFTPEYDLLNPGKASHLASFSTGRGTDRGKHESELDLNLQRPLPFLLQFVQYVILRGEIVQKTAPPSGENATYVLDFMGPQLSCREEKPSNRTVPKTLSIRDESSNFAEFVDLDLGNFSYTSNLGNSNYTCNTNYTCKTLQSIEAGLVRPITRNNVIASSLCSVKKSAAANQTEVLFDYLLETTETKCTERYVSYTANVSCFKGARSITYTARDLDPQPFMGTSYRMTWNSSVWDSEVNSLLSDERHQAEERLRYFNALTVYSAFWQVIASATHMICEAWPTSKCYEDWQSPNGTRMGIGTANCYQGERRKYFITPTDFFNIRGLTLS